MGVSIVIHT